MTIVSAQTSQNASPSAVGMGDLIPLHETDSGIWVDARLLHLALGVNARFNDWIARRLTETLASEGEDFYSELSKTSDGGRPAIQYMLSVDLSKEVAMLERTERGKAIRRYFIEAEKRLREGGNELPAPPAPALPTDPIELLSLSLEGLKLHKTQILELQTKTAQLQVQLNDTPIALHPNEEAMVHALCQELGKIIPGGFPAAYRAFKAHFGDAGVPLAKYSSLPVRRFDEACTYLRGLITQHSRGRLLGHDA